MKNKIDLQTLQQMHQAGLLDAAQEGYLELLADEPDNPTLLHALGILAMQKKDPTSAQMYLEKAASLDSKNLALQIDLGNVLTSSRKFEEAAAVYQRVLNLNPDSGPAYNNLGAVYFAKGDLSQAIHYFKEAVARQQNYVEAYYNLALAETKRGHIDDAVNYYKQILVLTPNHLATNFQLGCLLLEENRLNDAIYYFLVVEKTYPTHFETQSNLATAYLRTGKLNLAKEHYQNALAVHDKDTQILFNLGVINMQQGNTDLAIRYYQRSLQLNSEDFATHNNIAVAFLAKNHIGFALKHFKEALRLQPNNEAIAYTISVLSKDQRLLAAPATYIKTLFDAYADHYESHLLDALDYRVPDVLLNAVKKVKKIKDHSLNILDLGCGTGLCGVAFKPYAKTLIGVDLSDKMLDEAKVKNIYDELIVDDLQLFLSKQENAFDLMTAADVFVYIGDLASIFKSVYTALKDKGLFVFNTELSESEDFAMEQSGRFSHNKKYLDKLAKKYKFKVVAYEQTATRQQNNIPVLGNIFVLQKTLI